MAYDPKAISGKTGFARRLAMYLVGLSIGLVLMGYINTKRKQSMAAQPTNTTSNTPADTSSAGPDRSPSSVPQESVPPSPSDP